jgi:hypothetical protein
MTTSRAAGPVVSTARPVGFTPLEGATLSVLLALAGIELVGYRFGDSNQGITIPILKRFIDPSLYRGDTMVATADKFPTLFYRILAMVLPGPEAIPAAFFALYVVSIAAALAGVYRIGRWCGGPEAGLLAVLIAVPVRVGIANEALYRVQFSHSHLASALVIWAMAWFLEGRRRLPLLALSLGAYNHVLYSVYVLVPCLLVVLAERKQAGPSRTLQRLAAGTLPLLPFAAWALSHRVPMTQEWLDLLRLRSAHHSFPSAFGDSLPAAGFLLALAALTLSRLPRAKRSLVALFLGGFALQFVLGTVFTEFVPLKAVLQMQPHRCWRFLMLLLYGLAAEGVVAGWKAGGAARVAAVVTGVILVDPNLEPVLPLAVFGQAAVGRPTPAPWARLLGVGMLAGLGGWPRSGLELSLADYPLAALTTATVLGAGTLAVILVIGRGNPARRRLVGAVAAAATVFWLAPAAYDRKRPKWEKGPWREVQDWARVHTPTDAIFVTPAQETGFRVFSERTVVGEWKDGTQQYFDEGFASDWGLRMAALSPARREKLTGEELLAIARRFGASFVVSPPRARHEGLAEVFRNSYYAIYGVLPAAAGGDAPAAPPGRRADAS